MPDGYLYTDILMKLYLKSLKDDGKLMFKGLIPYTPPVLAQVLRHQIGTVEKALATFKELGLIEILDNGTIFMLDIQNFIGKGSSEGDRKKKYRERIKEEKVKLLQGGQMSEMCPPESEIESESDLESEKEKEREKESESKEVTNFQKEITLNDILNAYEQNIGKMEMPILTEITLMIQQHEATKEQIYNAIIKAGQFGGKTWKYVCTILVNKDK